MSTSSRGLGRGLDALLGGSGREQPVNPAEIRSISISSIVPNRHQPRADFSQEALEDLSASIKAQGVLQPVLVRTTGEGFELVAGERRLRASKMAGLSEIPALVRDMSDEQSLAIALIENLQREDLNAIEEAKGYKQLQEDFGLSQADLATQVGKSRSAVANALRLLNLPQDMQNAIGDGALTAGHGRALMSVEGESARQDLFNRITSLGLSVRQAEAESVYYKKNGHFPEPGGSDSSPKSQGDSSPRAAAVDERLEEVGASLEKTLGMKVRVKGTIEGGRITVRFSSGEDLERLLGAFGIDYGA